MKITVIGAGNMGGSLVRGWVKAGLATSLTVTAHTQQTLDRYKGYDGLSTMLDNRKAVRQADLVVIAVKPWLVDGVMDEILPSLDGKTVVSVAANAKHSRIDVYAMPNIAAEYGQSMTFLTKSESASDATVKQVCNLFDKVGGTMVVDERLMGAGMMMAGCGIAYVMRFMRAYMEAGVEMGFYPKDALQITLKTMEGAVSLINESGLHPEAAIDKVTTPGGVTIKGLNELDHSGFNSAVIRCLKAGLK